jgi:SAM-dependent methyltransferase
MRTWAASHGAHDEIYTEDFYRKAVDPQAQQSAGAIAASVVDDLKPGTAADLGCGTGAILQRIKERGVKVRGFEYSEAALVICRERGLDVSKLDLERDSISERFDVVVSTEVAEHLPARCAEHYVDVLCAAAPVIVFTAATPGQGGTDHVNEQPHSYWIDKFNVRGYTLDQPMSLRWRRTWQERGVVWWFYRNLMIFRRANQPVSPPSA